MEIINSALVLACTYCDQQQSTARTASNCRGLPTRRLHAQSNCRHPTTHCNQFHVCTASYFFSLTGTTCFGRKPSGLTTYRIYSIGRASGCALQGRGSPFFNRCSFYKAAFKNVVECRIHPLIQYSV